MSESCPLLCNHEEADTRMVIQCASWTILKLQMKARAPRAVVDLGHVSHDICIRSVQNKKMSKQSGAKTHASHALHGPYTLKTKHWHKRKTQGG